ncbi:MAG: recombinase RecA, partial [Propionibacterium sp.]|nr:recombinase RecA [Propionibacterium sp.]
QAEFDIIYGLGISREGSIIDMGVDAGIIRKAGAWFTYGSDQLGQGKENARTFLKNNPTVADEIEQKILTSLGLGQPEEHTEEPETPSTGKSGGRAKVPAGVDPVTGEVAF